MANASHRVMASVSHRAPTRAEFERLTEEYERLRTEVESLHVRVQEQAREAHTQFVRIAEMQAVLDEERIAAGRPHVPRPLFPAPHRD